jgi:multiple sugar transport system substrate-binding protein
MSTSPTMGHPDPISPPRGERKLGRREFLKAAGAVSATVALGGLAEACATSASPVPSGSSVPSSVPSSVSTPGPSKAPSGPVTITWWEPENIPGWKALYVDDFVSEFEAENPNIKVDVSIVNWQDIFQKEITAAAAGQLPDIWTTNYTWNASFIDLEIVHPINEFLTPDFVDQIFPAYLDLGLKRGDKNYGLPLGAATRALYFNKEVLRQAGVMSPPATYDDLVAAAVKIGQLPDLWPYLLQAKGEQAEQDFVWRFWSLGGDLVTPDLQPGINTPAGYTAMEFVANMAQKGLTQPNPVTTDYGKKIETFKTGKVGMMIDGSWWMGDLVKTTLDWGTAPIPAGSQSFNQVVTDCYLMNENSIDKEAAWKLMAKTAEDKWALRRDKALSYPAYKRTYANDPFFGDPKWAAFFANADNTKFLPGDLPKWKAMVEELWAQQQLALLGQKDPKQAIDDLAAKWQTWLKG